MLAEYVHELGGGFVMIGGPDSFGAGAWTNSELDKYILPGLSTARQSVNRMSTLAAVSGWVSRAYGFTPRV